VSPSRPVLRWSAVLLAAVLLVGVAGVTGPSLRPATAINGLGALTVVASGGAAEGAGWDYDAATGELTVDGDVSIDASELASRLDARDLTVIAQSITVSAAVEATVPSRSLILKSQASIRIARGVRVATDGGDVVLWADASGDLTDMSRPGGGIEIGVDQTPACTGSPVPAITSIVTNGGDIILSGGAVADVDALRSVGFASFASTMPRACSDYHFAIGVFAADLDAGVTAGPGGGSIVIRGHARSFTGMIWTVQLGGAYGGATALQTTGTGTVEIVGDTSAAGNANPGAACGGSHPSRNPWGISMPARVSTEQGAITLTGISTVSRPGPRGHALSGVVESVSGTITIVDATDPASPAVIPCSGATATDSNGPFLNGVRLGKGTLAASSSDVEIVADKVFFAGSAHVETTGTFTYRPRGTSILAVNNATTWSYPFVDLSSTAIGALTIGRPGNTSRVAIASAVPDIAGPITLYGDEIVIGGSLSTDTTMELHAAVSATQSAPITAADLRLAGAGTFALQDGSNLIGTVAGGSAPVPLGGLLLVDSAGGLTIGTAGGDGIVAAGPIDIATLVGDITLRAGITTADSSSDAIVVNAGRVSDVGDVAGGDLVIVGAPAFTTGAGGIVRLFSGSDPASTGLTALVGGAANTRTGVDETTTTFEPALASGGRYALYRSIAVVVDTEGEDAGEGEGEGEGRGRGASDRSRAGGWAHHAVLADPAGRRTHGHLRGHRRPGRRGDRVAGRGRCDPCLRCAAPRRTRGRDLHLPRAVGGGRP
jgi:hypothetical protein